MKVSKSSVFSEVKIYTPTVYSDERGFFLESFNGAIERDLNISFFQDNHSKSRKNVIRGIHFQWDRPMGKLCRVVKGSGLDLVVDLRAGSHTYGLYELISLSEENFSIVWVPEGFGHAFLALEDDTHFCYKCTALHNSAAEGAIYPFDETLNIKWPVNHDSAIISQKDKNSKSFKEYQLNPVFK